MRLKNKLFVMLHILICAMINQNLFAEPLKVSPIPWVQSNSDIPHYGLNGLPTMLQAIAEYGACGGSYSYRWDVNGDGDYGDPNEQMRLANSNQYGGQFATLQLDVQYPSVDGDWLYYPKVEVTCGVEIATTIFPILIKVDRICDNYINDPLNPNCEMGDNLSLTRQVYSSRAIDRGLWYLFKQTIHRTNDSLGHDEHLCYVQGDKTLYSTGQALNTFLRRGHGYGEFRDDDPYYRHMTQCGLHSILSTMQARNLSFDDYAGLGVDGIGFQFVATNGITSNFWSSYESTSWAEPIANFGNEEYISPVGREHIFGNNLKNISQDVADGLIQCMTLDGAWFYTCSNLNGFTDDASTNGWAPEALRLLKRKHGISDYDDYKTIQRNWLSTHCPNGNCSYDGGGGKLAGNALVGYGWTQNEALISNETIDSNYLATNAKIQSTISSIQNWFMTDVNHWGLYYIYAVTKGLRSFVPEITTLPNGVNWGDQFVDFFVGGKNTRYSNNTAKQLLDGSWTWSGNWIWGGYVNTNEKTALIIQIIQSWLEVFVYGRAYPNRISPNSFVEFDHSWTYTLDPAVSIIEYKWNVIDYVLPSERDCESWENGCMDNNFDGDCLDELEYCNEDVSHNGLIEKNEIKWDFSTSNLHSKFSFKYVDVVDWGDVKNHKITLRTVDNYGRIVEDDTSIEIQVSKMNHAPTVVSNPLGDQVKYQAYPNYLVKLDGRASYDADTSEIPFGGSGIRPSGIVDSVTSIHFDLNFDGDFDDIGEEGLNNDVSFQIGANVKVGDILAVPIRVCDDGQWTDLCIDGIDKIDCSICSYGSAKIEIIQNSQPPMIVDKNPYVVNIGFENDDSSLPEVFKPITIDLSESIDPDNMGDLRFEYSIVSGSGILIELIEYQSNPNDMGGKIQYLPYGDGSRLDLILARVYDVGGLYSEIIIEINVPNLAPYVDDANIFFDITNPPILENIDLQNLGNGWFRLSIQAIPNPMLDASIVVFANDVGGDVVLSFDTNNDNNVDYIVYDKTNSAYELNGLSVQKNLSNVVKIDVKDIEGRYGIPYYLRYTSPSVARYLTYMIDIGNDGFIDVHTSNQNNYTFYVDVDQAMIDLPIHINLIDEYGLSMSGVYFVDTTNRDPIFLNAQAIKLEQNDYVFLLNAFDENRDDVLYEIDFGDGSPRVSQMNGWFFHHYDHHLDRVEVIARVIDSRGGENEHLFHLEFDQPLPTIDQGVLPTNDLGVLADQYLPQQNQDVVIYDHVQGEEGRCIVFTMLGNIEASGTKIQNNICDITNENDMTYIWEFGDGTIGYGNIVGHTYLDDGLYIVVIKNANTLEVEHLIQVHISNTSPIFLSSPQSYSYTNNQFEYSLMLKDNGVLDNLKVEVISNIVNQVYLNQMGDDRNWVITWNNIDHFSGLYEIVIKVQDGRYDDLGNWLSDGNSIEQVISFYIDNVIDMYVVDWFVLDYQVFDQQVQDQQVQDQQMQDQQMQDHLISDQKIMDQRTVDQMDEEHNLMRDERIQSDEGIVKQNDKDVVVSDLQIVVVAQDKEIKNLNNQSFAGGQGCDVNSRDRQSSLVFALVCMLFFYIYKVLEER